MHFFWLSEISVFGLNWTVVQVLRLDQVPPHTPTTQVLLVTELTDSCLMRRRLLLANCASEFLLYSFFNIH